MVFVHGLGDGPDSWVHQMRGLPEGYRGVTTAVRGLGSGPAPDAGFSLRAAAEDVVAELDRIGVDAVHLCGLSLGAMIAFRVAVDHPTRVRSLVLAAGQVRPPRAAMAVQNALMRVLPARLVAPDGLGKARMLSVLRAVAGTDFSGELASVRVPTLVLCGSRDRPNLSASRAFAAGIPDAELRLLEGAGHRCNVQTPELFTGALNGFLTRIAS